MTRYSLMAEFGIALGVLAGAFILALLWWTRPDATLRAEPERSPPEQRHSEGPAVSVAERSSTEIPSSEPVPAPTSLSPSSEREQVSLSTLGGDLGDWVTKYIADHPNGPWIKIPQGAREMDLRAFAVQMKLIIEECEEANALLLRGHGDNLLAFSNDPRVKQNDRDRQQKLKDLLNSIWPGAMP